MYRQNARWLGSQATRPNHVTRLTKIHLPTHRDRNGVFIPAGEARDLRRQTLGEQEARPESRTIGFRASSSPSFSPWQEAPTGTPAEKAVLLGLTRVRTTYLVPGNIPDLKSRGE